MSHHTHLFVRWFVFSLLLSVSVCLFLRVVSRSLGARNRWLCCAIIFCGYESRSIMMNGSSDESCNQSNRLSLKKVAKDLGEACQNFKRGTTSLVTNYKVLHIVLLDPWYFILYSVFFAFCACCIQISGKQQREYGAAGNCCSRATPVSFFRIFLPCVRSLHYVRSMHAALGPRIQ